MNIYDKLTGNDMTREMKALDLRVKKLPPSYQNAWDKLTQAIWNYADFSGRNLMPTFEGIVFFLEESAADNLAIEEVLDEDIAGFVEELMGEDKRDYRNKLRKQLNQNVAKKLGRKES
ncbi:MAG: DUF1048 domain-containing protein [Enterococcus sp.]